MEQSVFRVTRDIGQLKKGDKVTIFFVGTCCDYKILVKKVDEEIYQRCKECDLKKIN